MTSDGTHYKIRLPATFLILAVKVEKVVHLPILSLSALNEEINQVLVFTTNAAMVSALRNANHPNWQTMPLILSILKSYSSGQFALVHRNAMEKLTEVGNRVGIKNVPSSHRVSPNFFQFQKIFIRSPVVEAKNKSIFRENQY